MRVIRSARALPRFTARPVVVIGTFDGVHRAHQALIRATVRAARRLHSPAVLVTFDRHPQHVLRRQLHPLLLTSLEERLAHFRALGVDLVWVVRFTPRFAQRTPERFVEEMLRRRLRARAIIVGPTFGFGRERRGDVALLRQLGAQHGVRVFQVPILRGAGTPINSSRVRAALAAGRLAEVRRLLGRPPTVGGRVIHGAGRGRELGFPTANIDVRGRALPPPGVYLVGVRDTGRWQPGIANVGVRPTFGAGQALTVEVHVLRGPRRLYTRHLTVAWLRFVRPERAFPTVDKLRQRIARDVSAARRWFARHRRP